MRFVQSSVAWASLVVTGWALSAGSAFAAEGDIQGQVVLDGAVPTVTPLVDAGNKTVRDWEVCGEKGVPDESLVVNADNKGIRYAVIYLSKKPANMPATLPPPPKEVEFDQENCQFKPHILTVQTGQTVKVLSGDPVSHNTRGNPFSNTAFNFLVAPKDRKGQAVAGLSKAEKVPTKVSCDIHAWMSGYWLILDHPYMAVTDADGKFEIKNLPEGEHSFNVWHERPGYIEKGSLKVKVVAGKSTEIPVIKVPVAKLSAK